MKLSDSLMIAGAGLLTVLALTHSAHAQSADALIDKLVEKGILSTKEANELREEADKGFTTSYQVKSGMPDWVTSLRLGGDLRLRYDGIYIDDPAAPDRNRLRYRLRFGLTAVLKDNFEVGVRLTSAEAASGLGAGGGGNPISGNDSFSDNGSKKLVFVDLAYAKWTVNRPKWGLSITGGKMENPFVFSDVLFDPDYTPEGFGEQVSYNISDQHALRLNLGEFVLDEISASSRDPYMGGAQLRWDSTWSPKVQTSFGISALAITGTDGLNNTAVPNQNRGNTRINVGTTNAPVFIPATHFNPIIGDGAVTYTLASFPCYTGAFPIRVAGDYVVNPAADSKNEGWDAGITFGKSGKKGTWEVTYRYKNLEADMWWEELVDSDTGAFYKGTPTGGSSGYGAGTNLRGHTVRGVYSPTDSLSFAVTYYLYDLIDEVPPGSDSHADRIQVDAIWKF